MQRGPRPALHLEELPPWHGWRYRSEASRIVRWIERYLPVTTGSRQGEKVKVAGFQKRILAELCDSLATFVSLPAANGKTTLLGAVALERICRGDDYAEVAVVATKQDQARLLVECAVRFVESTPELLELCAWQAQEATLTYRPTGSKLTAHPAKLGAVQGLNASLFVVDEIGFAEDEIVEALIARLGKRPDARLIGIGTPGFEPNMLERLRAAAHDDDLPAGVRFLEWAADPGAELGDRAQWLKANPAVGAGFLTESALEVQAALMPERSFRTYHLGQWIDGQAGWLPAGAWQASPLVMPPADGSEIVLAVEGTYRRTLAIVGAGMGGEIFLGWAAEAATDDEVRRALEAAAARWKILEISHPRRIRPQLFADLAAEGLPVREWDGSSDAEASSANAFYGAILEGRVAHDHDELISEHVGRLRVRWAVDGSLRLARPDDGTFADAALAARAAWWRAGALVDSGAGEEIRIF